MLKLIVRKIKNNYQEQKENLIKEILLKEYNISNYKIDFTENGKPFIVGNEIYLSISNDNGLLVLVFDRVPVGVDIQFYKKINSNMKKVLNLEINDSKEIIDNFSAREAIIKLEGAKLSNINDYNICDYDVNFIKNDKYVVSIAHYKEY